MFAVFARGVYEHKRCVYGVFMEICVYECLWEVNPGPWGHDGQPQKRENLCLCCVYDFYTVFMLCL